MPGILVVEDDENFIRLLYMNDLWEDIYICPIYAVESTTESANLRYGTLGYKMDAYEGMAKINLHSQSNLIITSVNQF